MSPPRRPRRSAPSSRPTSHNTFTSPNNAFTSSINTNGDSNSSRSTKHAEDPKRASDTLKAAVEAASQLPDPSLVAPLLKIVTRSKTTGIMEEAVFALGKFKDARKYRGRILETLVGEAKKVKPGNRPRMRGSQDSLNGNGTPYGRESGPGARWAALSASVPVALRELTGQDVRTGSA